MKKALLVTTVSGFVPQFEMENVRLLQDMGYEVHYAANYHNVSYGTDNHRLDGTGIIRHQVDFVRSPYDIKGNLKAYHQLYAVVNEGGFDLIHCHTPMGGVLTRLVVRKLKKQERRSKLPSIQEKRQMAPQVIYTAHGFHFYRGAKLRNWLLYFPVEKWLSRYTDVQITINREDYKRAKKHWHTNCKVVYVPGVGVDVDYFRGKNSMDSNSTKGMFDKENRERLRQKMREQLEVTPDTTLFLSVGELIPRKNHSSVLQVLARIDKLLAGENFRYIICGHGKLQKELHKQICSLGLENKVILPGYCEDIRPYFYACDSFVFPSLQEGMPVALLEAVASGCYCIVSDVRGNRDIADRVPERVKVYHDEMELEQMMLEVIVRGKSGPELAAAFDGMEDAEEQMESEKKIATGSVHSKGIRTYDKTAVKKKMRKVYGEIDVRK